MRPRRRRRGSSGIERTRYILGAIGLVVAAVVVWGFMHFMSSAGNEAASGQMQEIGAAQDVQAQMTGQQTIQSVEGLYAQSGSFNSITPQALKAFEPTYSYTNGPSTDPNTVSVASTANGRGAGRAVAVGPLPLRAHHGRGRHVRQRDDLYRDASRSRPPRLPGPPRPELHPASEASDTSREMDDAFRMVAARMPRTRRLTPFAARATVLLVVLGMLLVVFASFVASEQRAADCAARAARSHAACRRRGRRPAPSAAQVGAADPGTPDGAAVRGLLNEHAQTAATTAPRHRPASSRRPPRSTPRPRPRSRRSTRASLFVDGPSTGPSVVSVYAGAAGWAAAVGGAHGTCYWVAVAPDGRTRYGTGTPCTGMAALAADRGAW